MRVRRSRRRIFVVVVLMISVLVVILIMTTVSAVRLMSAVIVPPPQPVRWFIVVDLTASVDKKWLATYKSSMLIWTVLCRLREGDEVFLAPLDDNTDDGETRSVVIRSSGLLGVAPDVAKVRDEIAGWRQRDPQEHRGSDFGGAVRWISANVLRIRKNSGGRKPKFIALFFTDGEADGWQASGATMPRDVDIYVWGTKRREMDERLREVLTQAEVDVKKVTQVPFGDWESAARTFGNRYNRTQDEPRGKLLLSGEPITPQTVMKNGGG